MLKFLSKRMMSNSLGFIFLLLFVFSFNVSLVSAHDTAGYSANVQSGGADSVTWAGEADDFQQGTALGNEDPRTIVANIINIALGFLGILAICIIMYAGFLWMMSGGNPDKIVKAKHTLLSGVIGLVIILSSFAIASFVLDAIFRAAATPGGGGGIGGLPGGNACVAACLASPPIGVTDCDEYCHSPALDIDRDRDLLCSLDTTGEGVCDPSPTYCQEEFGSQWSCHPTGCYCVVENMGSCFNEYEDACTDPCKLGLSCFGHAPIIGSLCDDNGSNPPTPSCGEGNDSCYCCCSPGVNDQCDLIYPTLTCLEDQGDCDGGDRGLCCGCEIDYNDGSGLPSCGDNPAGTGCGDDACCHERPEVHDSDLGDEVGETVPADLAEEICTNPLISVQFDQAMQAESLVDNFFVVGEYDTPCPTDTTELFDNSDSSIMVTPRGPVANYCAVRGGTKVRNSSTGHFVDFTPSNFLEIDTFYHIVIRADEDISNNIDEGIFSYYGVSMNGDTVVAGGDIASFRTINDPSPSAGVCIIDRASLVPTSYLFRTAQNSAREVDDDSSDPRFDIDRDKDKLFAARAISSGNQIIASMPGYSWDWAMESSARAIVNFGENMIPPSPTSGISLAEGSGLLEVAEGITDGRSIVSAEVIMPAEDVQPMQNGNHSRDTSNVYVFICDNPWPPIGDDGFWEPWQPRDNAGNIDNPYNYDIYYCRDKLPKGTMDDLPAFDSAGIAGVSDGVDVLQQSYFSYQLPPPPGHIITARTTSDTTGPYPPIEDINYSDGGTVYLSWTAVSDTWSGTAPPEGQEIGGYRVYWGDRSGNYSNSEDVVGQGENEVYISGLVNERTYYFSVTAYTNDQSESSYYEEFSAIPHDVIATTTAPTILEDEIVVSETGVEIYWEAAVGAYGYQVSYGLDSDADGVIVDVDRYTGVEIEPLTPDTEYYFAVRIVDAAGNSGPPSLVGGAIFATTTLPRL